MRTLPRYRHQSLADLQHLVLDPLIRDRGTIAYPTGKEKSELADISGLVIWASVLEEVDAKIREQIKAGVWPLRLKTDDWASGEINCDLRDRAGQEDHGRGDRQDKQVVKGGELRMHTIVGRLVERDVLEKLGAAKDGNRQNGQ